MPTAWTVGTMGTGWVRPGLSSNFGESTAVFLSLVQGPTGTVVQGQNSGLPTVEKAGLSSMFQFLWVNESRMLN